MKFLNISDHPFFKYYNNKSYNVDHGRHTTSRQVLNGYNDTKAISQNTQSGLRGKKQAHMYMFVLLYHIPNHPFFQT